MLHSLSAALVPRNLALDERTTCLRLLQVDIRRCVFFMVKNQGAPDDDDVPNLELQVSRASLPVCPARLAPRALTNHLALIASSCAVAMGSNCLRTREQ